MDFLFQDAVQYHNGKKLDEDLIYVILSVVEEIPEGKVAAYGQIGRDKKLEELPIWESQAFF